MDSITEQLSQLQELSNEDLASLEENVLNEFSTLESQELTSQSVSQLTQLADAVEAVRTEQARRATEAQALQEAAAQAAARVKGPEAEASVENSDPSVPVEGEEAPVEAEAAMPTSVPPVPKPKDDEGIDNPAVPSGNPSDPAEDPADSLENPGGDSEEEKKKKLPGVPTSPGEASADDAATTEAAVEQPEGSEAAVEAPAEAEAAAEVPAEAEASVEEEAAAELSTETPAEAEASVEETSETNTEATVTAAANAGSEGLNIEVPAGHEPLATPASTTLTITAGADIPGISAGTTMKDTLEVADAFQKRLHTLRHVHGGDGEQHIVASFRQEFPEDRFLSPNDPMENTARIQDVTSTEAIVAAAGICLPLETRYDMGCDVGVTDRPVRDALARFGADRGGIRFFKAPTLTSTDPNFANATGYWRGDQSDPNSGTWHTYGPDRVTPTNPADVKPCLEMNCVAEETAYIEAITLCLTFNNLTTRTFPELIKRQNELALVAHARVAENNLLAQLEAGSTQVQAQAQVVGATREILNLFDRAVASYRFKHRMSTSAPLRGIFPSWVRNLLRADLALQMPGDGFDVFNLADSQIDNWFRTRNINPTWHLDGVGPALVDSDGAGSGTAQGFELPDNIEFLLFAEGAWLFLDGGNLDLGVIRDSSLVQTNQYKQFVESFEGVANIGCDSYWVSASYQPTGQAASLVDTL